MRVHGFQPDEALYTIIPNNFLSPVKTKTLKSYPPLGIFPRKPSEFPPSPDTSANTPRHPDPKRWNWKEGRDARAVGWDCNYWIAHRVGPLEKGGCRVVSSAPNGVVAAFAFSLFWPHHHLPHCPFSASVYITLEESQSQHFTRRERERE